MKARLPICRKTKERIREEVAAELSKQKVDFSRRISKLFCMALNEEYGFGRTRLTNLLNKVEELGLAREEDEVFWAHVDRYLKRIDMNFPDEDYEVMDK
ncbi:MAG: hypothetical protein E7536_09200 [Ruminococcaceae bacterium]|nr:hypothetical protein [Oscillospiraceae bacterium]